MQPKLEKHYYQCLKHIEICLKTSLVAMCIILNTSDKEENKTSDESD